MYIIKIFINNKINKQLMKKKREIHQDSFVQKYIHSRAN